MANFKFFYDYMSPLSRSLIVLFERNNVVCEKISVALRKGEHLSSDFGKNVNRFRKVPVIHDSDGFRLAETVAIYHYLGRKNIIPERWFPKDAKKLASINEFLQWNHNNLLLTSASIFYDAWIKPILGVDIYDHGLMVNVNEPLNLVRIEDSLNNMENIWLSDSKFLVSNEITYADLIASCALMQIIGLKLYHLEKDKYPKVNNWLENTKSFFNPEFDVAHKFVYKYGEMFGGKPNF